MVLLGLSPAATANEPNVSAAAVSAAVVSTAAPAHATAWNRIRFRLRTPRQEYPAAFRKRIDAQIAWFRRHRPRLATDATALELGLPHVVDAIAQRGLPGEVALIPLIESGFAGRAESHRGARGVWQLMPGTAQDLGLLVDDEVDERLHLFDATRAALDLIEHYHRVDGDWLRVYAAYNAGLARIRGLVRKAAKAGKRTDAWALALPNETAVYLARLIAAAEIVYRPERHGFALPHVPAIQQLVRLQADGRGRFSLAQFATDVGWDAGTAALCNPHLGKVVLRGKRRSSVLVPRHLSHAAARWLATPGLAEVAPPATWFQHRIARGDTLSGIARRYGVSIAALREANDLEGSSIRYGRVLNVPLPGPRRLAGASPEPA